MSGRTDAEQFQWLSNTPASEVRPEHQDVIRAAVNAAMDAHEEDMKRKAMDAEERG